MGFNPAHRFDAARRQKRQNEQVRQLRKRPHGHAEARTGVLEGAVTTTRSMPPLAVAVDPDNTIPEIKLLFEVRGVLAAGTCEVSWELNDVDIGADQTITTDPLDSVVEIAPPIRLNHGDHLKPTITSAVGASDLSLTVSIVTRQA